MSSCIKEAPADDRTYILVPSGMRPEEGILSQPECTLDNLTPYHYPDLGAEATATSAASQPPGAGASTAAAHSTATDFTTAGDDQPGNPGATDTISAGGSSDPEPDPPVDSDLGMTSKPPEIDNPQSPSNNKKPAHLPDILLWVQTPCLRAAMDGKYYPSFKGLTLRWQMKEGIPNPAAFNVYIDGLHARALTTNNNQTYWQIETAFVLPDTKYEVQIAAVDANENEYLFSPIYTHKTASATNCWRLIKRVGVLPCRMPDTQEPSITEAQIHQVMKDGMPGDDTGFAVTNALNEYSFGQVQLEYEIFDEYVMPNNSDYYWTWNEDQMAKKWDSLLAFNDLKPITQGPSADEIDVWLVPIAGWEGGVDYRVRVVAMRPALFVPDDCIHEIGHHIGAPDLYNWTGPDDDENVVGPDLTDLKAGGWAYAIYGDHFSPMGGSKRHFSAQNKAVFGWIPNDRILTVTQSGEYELQAVSIKSNFAPMEIRIPIPGMNDKVFYTVEYRHPYGWDGYPVGWQPGEPLRLGFNVQNGEPFKFVLVRLHWNALVKAEDVVGGPTTTFIPYTCVTPNNAFDDPHRKIRISWVDDAPPSAARIEVEFY